MLSEIKVTKFIIWQMIFVINLQFYIYHPIGYAKHTLSFAAFAYYFPLNR